MKKKVLFVLDGTAVTCRAKVCFRICWTVSIYKDITSVKCNIPSVVFIF